MARKSLQELTIKDNFMFGAVMMVPENCIGLLERTLEMKIERVEISQEKSMVYNPDFRGVRLDVYAKDPEERHFIVEMQVRRENLEKRARYYGSQMDLELLGSGISYEELPDTYVIFICDFDPFGERKYRYRVKKVFEEAPGLRYEDGRHFVYLSTQGTNPDDVPEELVRFLRFVQAPLADSEEDYRDPFVTQLQRTIHQIKADREMGAKYMLFEDLLKEERREGIEEGRKEGRKEGRNTLLLEDIMELLENKGQFPQYAYAKLKAVSDEKVLKQLRTAATASESAGQFLEELEKILEK